ncbi:MAG TPA: c-type cytochrome, partial [Acidimicrobiales bacterium]
QHAHMRFLVRVVTATSFTRWQHREATGSPRRPPGTAARRGARLFATTTCAGCHTVRGATTGTAGPDLTDFGSRPTIGAGTLANDPSSLARWITDPGKAKPGVHMPPTELTARQIADIAAYLEGLK